MLFKLKKYGEFNNYDLWKNLAFFFMVIDHLGYYFFNEIFILRIIGRVSFPIFAILHGMHYKKNNNKILILGVVLQFFEYCLADKTFPLNMLITFYFSGFILTFIEKEFLNSQTRSCFYLFLLFFVNLFSAEYFEYGIFLPAYFMLIGKIFSKIGKSLFEYLFTFSIFIIYFIYQNLNFNIQYNYKTLFFCELVLLYLLLHNFNIREYYNIKTKNIYLIFSRYSMEFYILHIMLFTVIKEIIN